MQKHREISESMRCAAVSYSKSVDLESLHKTKYKNKIHPPVFFSSAHNPQLPTSVVVRCDESLNTDTLGGHKVSRMLRCSNSMLEKARRE